MDTSRHLKTGSLIGAIVSAFLASLCCVGPLVFAVLGLGGAGLLLKLEPYRPYFTVITLALLAGGFFLTYRNPKSAAPTGDDCGCEQPRSNRLWKWMLWTSTALVLGFLLFPAIAPHLFN